jgi:hypothetical protein
VAFIILLPLFASFSTAIPIEKNIYTSYNKITNSDNGTVTLRIHRGFNEHGFLSHIGYSTTIDNTLGTKPVNYSINITFYYITHNAYSWEFGINYPLVGSTSSYLNPPFPMYPFKISIAIKTNTSTNLSLSRTGIMLFNCYVLFIKGNETVTGPS